jgi:tRNA-specific 2-thiouridylase
VKFRELRVRAASFGSTHVATGHYARITRDDEGWHLLRGADREKDQSYFLYGLTQEELGATLFPVGGFTKPEVRELAREAGLVTASKPESQDICFVSGSVGDFVAKIGGRTPDGGLVVDRAGAVLGSHDGVHRFTVGQRRGLHLGGREEPLYVLEIDVATNRIVVGRREELERSSFVVRDVNWVAPAHIAGGDAPFEARAQLRSRHDATRVQVVPRGDGWLEVSFLEAWTPVSRGQAAVFYSLDDREVLGGGRIER